MLEYWTSVVHYFEAQSGLANFFGIATPILLSLGIFRKRIGQFFADPAKQSVSSWIDHKIGPTGQGISEAATKFTRVAIVDDEPQDFPIEYLRSLGYPLKVYSSISIANWRDLAEFDIVILDIAGVVEEDHKNGGLQLIRKLKELSHPPLIIAVSGKRYDPTVTEFFRLAEAQMKKPLANIEFADKIKELLSAHVSPRALARKVDDLISASPLTPSRRRSITLAIIRMIAARSIHQSQSRQLGEINKELEHFVSKLVRTIAHYEAV